MERVNPASEKPKFGRGTSITEMNVGRGLVSYVGAGRQIITTLTEEASEVEGQNMAYTIPSMLFLIKV